MGSKSSRTVNVKLPLKDELQINKYARSAACCLFLQGSFSNVMMLTREIDIIDDIVRKLDSIIKDDSFVFDFIDDKYNTEWDVNKLRMFSPTFNIITEEDFDKFLDEHEPLGSDKNTFYDIEYEYNKDYIVVRMKDNIILARHRLK